MRSKLIRWLLITAVAAGALLAAAMTALFVVTSGGIQGAILNLRPVPDPNGPRLQALLRQAKDESEQAIVQAEQALNLTERYQQTADHTCQEGQNNWKVHDGYVLRCMLATRVLHGYDGEFPAMVARIDETLRRLGWSTRSGGRTPSEVMSEYFDRYQYGPPPRGFPEGYTVYDLPFDEYVRGDLALDMGFVERRNLTRNRPEDRGLILAYPAVRDALQDRAQAIFLTIRTDYYKE